MKKINQILIGTHNSGKFKEISFLLPKDIKKISPKTLKIKSPYETGKTYKENSKLKAEYFSKKTGLITISDDSGLAIDCLHGKPGIHSARWATKYGGFHKAMKNIINLVDKKNKNKKIKNFKAKFICSLSIKFPKGKIINVTGKIVGKISNKIIGKKGFGYDPIFIPINKKETFGQMNHFKKIKMDHRFIAYKKLKKKIKTL
tara:strand:- start:484 stop:1089 length:606 start_codon:yes stop_codon:yes gene_type:complete